MHVDAEGGITPRQYEVGSFEVPGLMAQHVGRGIDHFHDLRSEGEGMVVGHVKGQRVHAVTEVDLEADFIPAWIGHALTG